MPVPRRFLRLLSAVALATLVGWSVAGTPAGASGLLPGGTTTTSTPASTTTSTTTGSTTTPPSSTGTASTTTTTTLAGAKGSPPATGVPAVPTAGPPTSVPAPGKPAPPPVNVGPSVAAVNTDLAQLAAISGYGRVKAAVRTAESHLAAAKAAVAAAQARAVTVGVVHQAAVTRLAGARAQMAGLALAAYTGEAYAKPGSTQGLSSGTVTTPGGVTPDIAAEEEVLLGIVVDQTENAFTGARVVLRTADAAAARANAGIATAASAEAGAARDVADANAALVTARRAATVAGAAAQQTAVASTPSSNRAELTSATSPSMSEAQAVIDAPKILGPTEATAKELAAWFDSTAHKANTTVPIAQLADDYASAAKQTGVRADLAFAQSVIETGFFSFPAGGQLTAADNNFAGIGACDSCSHGWSFPDALTGVTAQEELLEAYASPTKVATPLIGPVGVGGCCATWVALAGKWATSKLYGVEILSVYKQILDWVIPRRLVAAGLAPSPTARRSAPAA